MSVVEAVDEAVQNATTACAGFAALIDEAKIDVFRFNGTVEQLSQPGGEEILMKRVELTSTGKSIHRAVILDKEDEWDQRQLELSGVRDVIITYDARVAGAADIPATRLFGKAPDGMNATGDGDLTNYYQSIGSKQEKQLRPMMERLDAVVMPSAGVPTDMSWSFSPLMVLSEKDQAEIEKTEAETVQIYVNSGLFPDSVMSEVVTNRLIESQRFPGLQDAMDKATAQGFDPDEVDPSEIVPIPTQEGGAPPAQQPMRRAAKDAATDIKVGDWVEFASDWQTEKGPSSGKVVKVEGDSVTIAHSDNPGEIFSIPALKVKQRTEHYRGGTLWIFDTRPA
jgi:hypothetical protein